MFASLARALRAFADPRFVRLVLVSAFLTLLLFAGALALAEVLLARLPILGSPMVNHALELLAPLLFLFLLAVLGAPVAALFGSLFLDRFAAGVEARDYPGLQPAPAGMAQVAKAGLRLAGLVLGADLLLLPLDIGVPGLGEAASILVNGWLLGREYFEMAALRHVGGAQADALRRAHGWQVFLGGLAISILSVIPVADLVAPLFGTVLMVHLFHRLNRESRE